MATSPLPDLVACYRHADHLTGAHCTRCGRPICGDCMMAAPVGHHCPSCVGESLGAGTGTGPGTAELPAAQGRLAEGRLTVVVGALVAVNVVVFLLTSLHRAWELEYAQIPAAVAHGQAYRLLTAAFIHENLTHLVFNMASLVVMGPPVERALGRRRFLVLYVLAALGGSVCSFLLGPVFVAGIGASGAIIGVFGAWFSLARASRADTGVIVLLIAILMAYSFYDTTIDWRAHVGGLVAGAAVGAAYAFAARRPARARVALETTIVVGTLGLFAALVIFRSAQL